MKRISRIILVLLTIAGGALAASEPKTLPKPRQVAVPEGVDAELIKDAGNKAIKALLSDFLRQHDVPMKRYAILPLQQDVDGDYFTTQLRNYFSTQASANGYELYTRMDDEFKMLLTEIAWGQSYGDTMDPGTVQKFGRLQGVQGLITGRIGGVSKYGDDDVKVRFTMQVFEVETGKLVWGEEKVAYGKRDDVEGGLWSSWDSRKTKLAIAAGCGLIVLLIVLRVFRAVGAAARPR